MPPGIPLLDNGQVSRCGLEHCYTYTWLHRLRYIYSFLTVYLACFGAIVDNIKANVDIIYEGIVVVDFKNLGLQLVEKSPDDPYSVSSKQLSVGSKQLSVSSEASSDNKN